MYWRDMTETEYETLPETRLAGALRWMVVGCAVTVIVPALGVLSAIVVLSTGGVHANPGNVFSWLDSPHRMGPI